MDTRTPTTIPPGREPTAHPPPPGANVPRRPAAWATSEFVSGTPNVRLSSYAEALPFYIDDATKDFGDDLYERMLNDAQVYSCVEILKLNVLGEGYTLQPAVEKPTVNPGQTPGGARNYGRRAKLDYDLAKEVCDFCQDNIDGLYHTGGKPFEAFLYEMMDALALGNKVAEKVYRDEDDAAAPYPRLNARTRGRAVVLDRLKVKPRRCVRFVVNAFRDVVALTAVVPGRYDSLIPYGFYGADPSKSPANLPREKFVVFTYNPKDNDPRGHSVLRPAYDPWWNKVSAKPEYAKYLAQFGGPSLFGTTPEDVPSDLAADGLGNLAAGTTDSPQDKLLRVLKALRNGYVAVGPDGTKVQVIQASGTGTAFTAAFDFWDRQIAKAVLGQTLATEEGQHQARAAAQVHKDVLDIVLKHVRRAVAVMIRNDILFHLVAYNYGEADARLYTPKVFVGPESDDDWSSDVAGVSQLVTAAGGQFVCPDQYPYLWKKLGLPPSTQKPEAPQPGQPPAQAGAGAANPRPPQQQPPPRPLPPGANGQNPAAPYQQRQPATARFSRGRSLAVTDGDLARARMYLAACTADFARERKRVPKGRHGGGEFAPGGGTPETPPPSASGDPAGGSPDVHAALLAEHRQAHANFRAALGEHMELFGDQLNEMDLHGVGIEMPDYHALRQVAADHWQERVQPAHEAFLISRAVLNHANGDTDRAMINPPADRPRNARPSNSINWAEGQQPASEHDQATRHLDVHLRDLVPDYVNGSLFSRAENTIAARSPRAKK